MVSDIANILVQLLEPLQLVDKITGVVQRIVIKNTDLQSKDLKPKQTNILVPASIILKPPYDIFLPDSRFKSILFFEENEVKLVNHNKRFDNYETILDLCCWFNYEKLNMIKTKSDFQLLILNALPDQLNNSGLYTRIYLEVANINSNNKSAYEPYGLDETIDQYLMYPYDAFKITFDIKFSVANICITEINQNNPANC